MSNYGPLWQIQSQIKHHESCALSYRRDADALLKKADECDKYALEYKKAEDVLLNAGLNNT